MASRLFKITVTCYCTVHCQLSVYDTWCIHTGRIRFCFGASKRVWLGRVHEARHPIEDLSSPTLFRIIYEFTVKKFQEVVWSRGMVGKHELPLDVPAWMVSQLVALRELFAYMSIRYHEQYI